MKTVAENKALKAPSLAISGGSASPTVAAGVKFAYSNGRRVVIVAAQDLPALSGTVADGQIGNFTLVGDGEGNLGWKFGTTDATKTRYVFATSATDLPVRNAVYTNNSKKFTVKNAIGKSIAFEGTGAPTASGTLTLASGTGPATITFASVLTSQLVNFVGEPTMFTDGVNNGNRVNIVGAGADGVKYGVDTLTDIALVTVVNASGADFVGGTTNLDASNVTVVYSELGVAGY